MDFINNNKSPRGVFAIYGNVPRGFVDKARRVQNDIAREHCSDVRARGKGSPRAGD